MNRRAILTLAVAGAAGIVSRSVRASEGARRVTIYKDPQCGCCGEYADYLRSNGFDVSIVDTHDLPLIHEQHGVPTDLQGCHLSMIGGYAVSGHVPIKVINQLLKEKPAIAGITLPGMPTGSPGMSGQKTAPFTIYKITKGSPEVYAVE